MWRVSSNLLLKVISILTLRRGRSICVLICAGMMMSVVVSGQERLGGANGTVTDVTNAVIPGATVTLSNNDTGVVNRTVTSPAGSFTFVNILPGTYTVTVEARGFKRFVQTALHIEVGVSASVLAQLPSGSETETISVNAQAVTLDTESPAPGTTIEPQLLRTMPAELSGGSRNILTAPLAVTPGVGIAPDNAIGGGQAGSPYIYYNGLPEESEQFNVLPPYDFVSEARVDRATFDAQFGWSDGDIKLQTKSGTNQYHGSLFYINRNSFFDSKGFGNATVPQVHQNNYGGSFGGPVRIPKLYNGTNRTFFWFSYDGYRQNNAVTGYATVPTLAARGGDFSGILTTNGSGTIINDNIYDPLSPNSNNPQQFQYNGVANVINPARFSPTSLALLQYIPQPNRVGTGVGNLAQNFYYNYKVPFTQQKYGVSLDEHLTPTQTINFAIFRFSQNQTYNVNLPIFGPPDSGNPLNSFINVIYPQSEETLNYSYAIKPNLVLTTGLGFVTLDSQSKSTAPSTTIPAQNLVAAPARGFPGVAFGGIGAPVPLGENGYYNSNYAINYLSFYQNWLWTRGKHNLNFGAQGLYMHYGSYTCACVGSFTFSGNTTTSNISNSSTTFTPNPYAGEPFASFLLGEVDRAAISYTPPQTKDWEESAFYVQDNIKLTHRLTLNAGLRWDLQIPYHTNNNEQDFVTPGSLTVPNPVASGQLGVLTAYGACPDCADVTRAAIHWKEFGPRLGGSYQIGTKTVVSAGYSLVWVAYNNFQNDGYAFGTASTFGSRGTNQPGFGSWDTQTLNFPPPTPFSATSLTGSTVGFFDSNKAGQNPYMQTFIVSIQRELPWNIYLRGDFIDELGIHQMRYQTNQINNIPENAPAKYGALLGQQADSAAAQAAGIKIPFSNFKQLLGGNATVMQALRPYPQYLSIANNFAYDGTNNYKSLQLELRKRVSDGLFFLVSGTYQKNFGTSATEFGQQNPLQVNPYNPKAERAAENPTYNITVTGSYDLPVGSGKRFLNNRSFTGELFGGWQLAWVTSYIGGLPFTVVANGSPYGYGNRANRNSSVPIVKHSWQQVKTYIKGGLSGPYPTILGSNGAFTDPGQYAAGNAAAAYTSLRGPATPNENLSLIKYFTIEKSIHAQFRVDYFNVFNRWMLGNCMDKNVSDGTFGKVTGLCGSGQRQGQAQLRFDF